MRRGPNVGRNRMRPLPIRRDPRGGRDRLPILSPTMFLLLSRSEYFYNGVVDGSGGSPLSRGPNLPPETGPIPGHVSPPVVGIDILRRPQDRLLCGRIVDHILYVVERRRRRRRWGSRSEGSIGRGLVRTKDDGGTALSEGPSPDGDGYRRGGQ